MILDNSMRSAFKECPRRFYWRFERLVGPKETPGYFTFGRIWGLELQRHYSEGEGEAVCFEGLNVEEEDLLKEMLLSYKELYQGEPFEILSGETGFQYPIKGILRSGEEISYGGSFDGILQWPLFGLILREDKTTGMWLSDAIIQGYRHSSQVTGYVWYASKLWPSQVPRVLVNIATKRRGGGGKGTPSFMRTLETRSRFELEEFEYDVLWTALMIERSRESNHWPVSTNHIECVGGIGRKPCFYRPLCLQGIWPLEQDPLGDFPQLYGALPSWVPWEREEN